MNSRYLQQEEVAPFPPSRPDETIERKVRPRSVTDFEADFGEFAGLAKNVNGDLLLERVTVFNLARISDPVP